MEIAGGKLLLCEDAGAPPGTTLTVRDLFFNTPARRKFLKSETTELAHVTAMVTHYALAHPDKHFELHSATHALLVAPPVRQASGAHLSDLRPGHARSAAARWRPRSSWSAPGCPSRRPGDGPRITRRQAGMAAPQRLHLQTGARETEPQLDLLLRQSPPGARPLADARGERSLSQYSAPTSFPVVLLFVEMPPEEVDVNVHPAKTEVRFRQASWLHDFVRDTIRNKLTMGRPAAGFLQALTAHPSASPALVSPSQPPPSAQRMLASRETPSRRSAWPPDLQQAEEDGFRLTGPAVRALSRRASLRHSSHASPARNRQLRRRKRRTLLQLFLGARYMEEEPEAGASPSLHGLASLRPLGQLRDSFILAVNQEGLWIIDQHVAHERVFSSACCASAKCSRWNASGCSCPC